MDFAINSAAAIMIHHYGWYYPLATHGSCCRGAGSGYNIRVDRTKKVTGPFLDHEGIDMIQGGRNLFPGSNGRFIGPGHFGLIKRGDCVQKFSPHYEADRDRALPAGWTSARYWGKRLAHCRREFRDRYLRD